MALSALPCVDPVGRTWASRGLNVWPSLHDFDQVVGFLGTGGPALWMPVIGPHVF